MNAPLRPELLLSSAAQAQAALPLATAGVQRYVWDSRWGAMLIEVVDDQVFVNGQRVMPHVMPNLTPPVTPPAGPPADAAAPAAASAGR